MLTELRRQIGARLKRARQDRGLTQEQLAEAAGFHTTYIAKVEAGDRTPSLETLIRLSSIMNVSLQSVVAVVDRNPDAAVLGDDIQAEIVDFLQECGIQELHLIREFIALLQRSRSV